MKRFMIALSFFISLHHANAGIVYWDGEGADGQWATAANWVGDVVPAAVDHVVLDNSVMTAGYQVALPTGNTGIVVLSLRIYPASGKEIILLLPVANTATSAFRALGSGDAVVLERGAVFKNSSGAGSGTPVAVSGAGFFRINNGGRYIHNTPRGHTDMLVSRLSAEAGTEQGVFEFDVPGAASYTVSVSNRVYGTVVFSATTSGAQKTYASSGSSPLVIRGDLIVRNRATLTYGSNTDELHIDGNCVVEEDGVFNISNGSDNATIIIKGDLENKGMITETGSSLLSSIRFEGSAQQAIDGQGSLSGRITVVVDNTGGVLLRSALVLPFNLELKNGKIFTTSSNLLTVSDDAVCIGGSSGSFIEGPIRKVGDDDFEFPVGVGGIYAPIAISGGGSPTDVFTAEYRRSNPQTTTGLGGGWQQPIHHISSVEYWLLNRNNGSSAKAIRLSVTPLSFVRELSTLLVSSFTAGQWESAGGASFVATSPALPYVSGSFSSGVQVESFSAFTIGTTDDEMLNPLPLHQIKLLARNLGEGRVEIKWKIEECCGRTSFVELQRAGDDDRFVTLEEYSSFPNGVWSAYIDASAVGLHKYRLKQNFTEGQISYSSVAVVSTQPGYGGISLAATMVRSSMALTVVVAQAGRFDVVIANAMGVIVRKINCGTIRGRYTREIPMGGLPAGLYFVWGEMPAGKTNTVRFLKIE